MLCAATTFNSPPQFGQEALAGASCLRRLADAPTDLLQLQIEIKTKFQRRLTCLQFMP
jgi:hypothetical protein